MRVATRTGSLTMRPPRDEDPPGRAIRISSTDPNITACAGVVLIRAAAAAVGLGISIASQLRLKERAPGTERSRLDCRHGGGSRAGGGMSRRLADRTRRPRPVGAVWLRRPGTPRPRAASSNASPSGTSTTSTRHCGPVNLARLELLGMGPGDSVTLDFDSTYVRS